jgi:hypothetical protein
MPAKVSATLKVLHEIRDEIRGVKAEVADVRREVADVRRVSDERFDWIVRRTADVEIRIASELSTVGSALVEVKDLLRDRLDVRDKVEDHERRIALLERGDQ